jgi:hypothetical protein
MLQHFVCRMSSGDFVVAKDALKKWMIGNKGLWFIPALVFLLVV